jgi:histidine triad (HIT) family protein
VADCLFCRIAQKEIPSTIIEETPSVLAFRDIAPKAPVHVLVIPKEHIESLMQVESKHAKILADIHEMIRVVARKEKINETGFRVSVNVGRDSGQAVAHLHYHVLGGRRMAWPPG